MGKFLLILFLAMNLLGFILVKNDKEYAGNLDKENRITETEFIAYSAIGCSVGILTGFKIFNHKTAKSKAYIKNAIYILLIENAILYFSLFFNFRKRRE